MKRAYESIRPQLKTGDILLFSGRGFASNLIKLATWSKFSHVATVKVGKNGLRYCWESTTMNKGESGVQSTPLCEKLREYNGRVWVRRLHIGRGPEFYQAVDAYDLDIGGTRYESNLWELAGAAMPWRNTVDFTTIFCAEKEAEFLKRVGAIKTGLPSNEFTPADFSKKRGTVDDLMWAGTNGTWLGGEIELQTGPGVMTWDQEMAIAADERNI